MPDHDHPAQAFHREVDQAVARFEELHRERLQCTRGCSGCCVDGITVFEIEAELIRLRHGELLAAAQPHPEGGCAFLDGEGACRIYGDRPYVCRTQGLPLRWVEDGVEKRDICGLNEPGPPLVQLRTSACWPIGPAETKLRALQLAACGDLTRVPLRALFDPTSR
jgi:uncharacterized protein